MKVEVVETTLVPPSEATPRHALWLSNLDLAVPKTHTPLVYYYPKPAAAAAGSPAFFEPARVRDALARALVPFYPLAGRLATGPDGRIEIDCTGEGALFAVARADFAGDEVFRDFEPSPEARRLLVPFAESGEPPCVLAMVQVTFLKCGGVAVGTGMHHVTMDGAGARGGPARGGGVAVPRPDPAPGALPAARPLRAPGLLPVLPQRRAPSLRHARLRRPAQAPSGHPVALRAGGVHLLRGDRAPVARHVRRPGPPRRRRHAAPRTGQHPAAAPPAAPRGLLRQRDRAGPGDREGGRRAVAAAGVRGGADQARGVPRGRRVRAVRDRLPRVGVREGQPGGARAVHAGVGPVGGQLAGHAHLRRRLRVGTPGVRGAGADVRQRHGVRDAGPRQGRPYQRALRARARVPADLREGILRGVITAGQPWRALLVEE